jgi:hypothetical protein
MENIITKFNENDIIKFDKILKNMFTSLNKTDYDFIFTIYLNLIKNISNLFYIDLNNLEDSDFIEMILLLIPFINNINDLKNISSFNDIYIRKRNNKYIYSNIQYNRCGSDLTELNYNQKHFEDNYKLLLITLEIISNRLYINWDDVYPLSQSSFNNYKTSEIYINTIEAFNNSKFIIHDYNNYLIEYKHLYVGTIYNVLHNYLYKDIININDNIIYQKIIKNNYSEKNVINFFKFLSEIFTKDEYYDNWCNLNDKIQRKFLNILNSNKHKDIIEYVFLGLLYTGTLSKYGNKINDLNLIDNFNNDIYYLTNTTYNEVDEFFEKTLKEDFDDFINGKKSKKVVDEIINPENKIVDVNKIDEFKKLREIKNFRKNHYYISIYGLKWISQIKFFHKFINNRVIFVTGGTGVGKSTQIPKLLLYGLKSFDYKFNGKIICTQPRKRSTEQNAKTISEQMGIKIPDFKPSKYIQYQHGDDLIHSTSNKNNLMLRLVTDKILLNQILSTPLLINKYMSNIYDIIIIDEAHEHNVNMDLILTIMKQYIYYNNSIKLIIISATMDDDEPIYRRYYKYIDDNKKYPLNVTIQNYKLNRINIDRRVHISKPKQDTLFNIREFYSINNIDSEKDRNNEIVKIIQNIINKDTTKDILIFKSGIIEITKCIEILNNYIPSNVLIIPYISTLEENIKSYIEVIHKKNRNLIKIDRNVKIEELKSTKSFEIGNGNYNKFIIIATNIAEASITIDTLTHVIDDGMQKVKKYSYTTELSKLIKIPIAETNRLQRKGRVGRKADGDVYYLYKKGYLENMKQHYKICTENVLLYLIEILKGFNSKILFDFNVNKKIEFNNKKYLNDFIKKYYYIGNKFYDYYNNEIDIEKTENNKIYENGYPYKTIEDVNGEFYIIHPNELNITRKMDGKIIKIKNEFNLQKYLIKYNKLNLIYNNSNNELFKTNFGILLNILTLNLFNMDDDGLMYSLMLVLGKKLNIFNEIVKIIIIIKKIVNNKNMILIKSLVKETKSEIIDLFNIVSEIKDEYFENEFKSIINKISEKSIASIIDKCLNNICNIDYDNNLSFYDKISIILMIVYGNNIVKKIINTEQYINIFNPVKNNIKTIDNNAKILYKYKYDLLIYIKNNLSNKIINNEDIEISEISLIHTFDYNLLKYINYQFDIESINNKLDKLITLNDDSNLHDTIKNIKYLININKNYNKKLFKYEYQISESTHKELSEEKHKELSERKHKELSEKKYHKITSV